jgi:pimeloyl-ACP methyl ester carboxylesterase
LIAVAGALALVPGTASAASACDGQAKFDWMGDSLSTTVSIPSLTQPNGNTSYDGTILKPADDAAFPGPRPVVLLQHGLGGNQCAQYWSARDLAGHGYVAIVWTAPGGSDTPQAFFNAVDAMRSAIAFVRGAGNPYLASTDGSRMALAGHSLGSIVASFVQQDPDPGVRAVIALDTLRRWVNGDPGGAVFECAAPQQLEVTPRVPALGFAKDAPCDAKPDFAPADLKLPGFDWWREHEVPVVELVMAGYNHLDFSAAGNEQKHRDLAGFMEAWLGRWLGGDEDAADVFLERGNEGLLSTRFLSGAYLPGEVDTRDFRAFLADDKAPNTKREAGPGNEVGRDRARRGIAFRFGSSDASATFECRLDTGKWKGCESPRKVKVGTGRHTFRVRATDARGNTDPSPAAWKFTVSR